MILGTLLGMGIACLIWGIGMVVWCVIQDKRDDRRFDTMIRGMDAGRDKALRELGVGEETIALFYTKREEILNEHNDS